MIKENGSAIANCVKDTILLHVRLLLNDTKDK